MHSTRYLILPFIFFSLTAFLFADPTAETPLVPYTPSIMAQGGASAATASGFQALYTNPAAYAGDSSLTLLSTSMWIHSTPSALLPVGRLLAGGGTPDQETRDLLEKDFEQNGGGFGGMIGMGYVGNRVGIGVTAVLDSYFFGNDFPLGLQGMVTSEISFTGGLAFPVQVGKGTLYLGGDVRPFVRVSALTDAAETAGFISHYLGVDTGGTGSDYMSTTMALDGYGLGVNLGSMWKGDHLTLAAVARDAGNTVLSYSRHSLQEVWDSMKAGGLPRPASSGEPGYVPEGSYFLPTDLRFGIAYRPTQPGSDARLKPVYQLEMQDVLGTVNPWQEIGPGIVSRLHLGAEIGVGRALALRAGVNQGYPTAGFGLSLPGVELNAAMFGRETGSGLWDRPAYGASVDLAIRF